MSNQKGGAPGARSALGRLRDVWNRSSLVSTGLTLLLMVVLQTFALGFEFESVGAWFAAWVGNWVNILRNNAIIGMIALGMTFVIITGGIDLAVGSTLVGVGTVVLVSQEALVGALTPALGEAGVYLAIVLAILAGLLAGAGVGTLTGLTITKGKVPPFIVTLGTMNIIRSVAQHFMQGRQAPQVPEAFKQLSNLMIGPYRLLPILYWAALAAVLYVVSRHTAFGRHIYAVGSNERTTRLSGINTDRVKIGVYALMGLIVAIAAITESARMGSMNTANAGMSYELDAIAAVVVGGTSMAGGRGSIGGSVMGMLIIGVMNNLLNLLGVPVFLRNAFKGAIVVAAVLLQRKDKER